MAKKIKTEDGKVYKEHKPFYKRWWFIVIVIILAFGLIGSALGDDKDEAKKVDTKEEVKTKTVSNKENEQEEEKIFRVGDTVDLKGYQIKVNSVDFSNGSEFITPDEGKQFIIVNLTITNKTGERQSYNPLDYSLVANGNSETAGFTFLDGVETMNSGDLDPEATVTGNLVGQVDPNAKLKLRYEGNFFIRNHNTDIELN
ncbi:DUF4352 domain-containing protein [Vagococcus elongatus]|uniref:DUF4352 domain-containing protein n=1 Tax=Vagococcus elongatus TaxID=180344 RepID=A0A430AI55_9ENTE|nr:DUF4352 domain-containing protein [Vagococcus elongatus]RSU07597.1 hypothetical protein CBF29_13495 [Vagococcus elongatus]